MTTVRRVGPTTDDGGDAPGGTTLRVIGAGFGRTGTTSMKVALDRLGLGPTHHMFEVFDHPEQVAQWTAALRGEADPAVPLAGYGASVDFPSSAMWEQLWRATPGSTVLLTTRPADEWWRSFDATIGPPIRSADDTAAPGSVDELFHLLHGRLFDHRSDERDVAIAAYEAHRDHVLATVPPEQLVVHHVGDGWGPLCEHFDLAVPDEPYPSENSTQAFRDGHARPGSADSGDEAPG